MKKIMFNDQYGLTQAVLDDRKTQTRRAIRLKDGEYVNVVPLANGSFMSYVAKKGCLTAHVGDIELPEYVRPLTPNYSIGTEVAVAQRYSECNRAVCLLDSKGWNNKMFTKALLLPHRIRIMNIRVAAKRNGDIGKVITVSSTSMPVTQSRKRLPLLSTRPAEKEHGIVIVMYSCTTSY